MADEGGAGAHPVRIPRPADPGTYRCVCGGSHPIGARPHTPEEVRQLLAWRRV